MASIQKSADDILGLEFDWIASDQEGHVALFSTAGAGYAPDEFLRDTGAYDAAIDKIIAMPSSSAVRFSPVLAPGYLNTWKLVAERGLYAFDCDPRGDRYHLVAAPVVPIRIDDLPPLVADVAAQIRLELRFDAQTWVTSELLRRHR